MRKGNEGKTHFITGTQLQGNLFSNGRRSPIRAWFVSLLFSKLRPFLTLGNSMLNYGFLQYASDTASDLRDSQINSEL
jgi:hypothetical protein